MDDELNNAIHVNPGTGNVRGANCFNAYDNMRQLIADCPARKLSYRRASKLDYGDGRYAFWVRDTENGKRIEVQMPGWKLDRVRYIGAEDQNPFDFPRLYVDGSSWLWKFAVNILNGD